MADIKPPENIKELPLAIIKNMITLATSGFGVVVALAWNDAIKEVVTNFIQPHFGDNGSMLSLFIFAVAVTLLAIFVTMQLSSLQRKFEGLHEKLNNPTSPEAALENQEFADTCNVKIGKVYQHYKGSKVKVIELATHSETLEKVLAYSHLDTGATWVRPLTMFCEEVTVDGKKVQRFKEVKK